jgi:hypothetical protein
MTILAPLTIPVIADQIRKFGTVTLSAETAHELSHRAAHSYTMEITLDRISKGDSKEAEWSRRVLVDEKRTRPKLKFPSRLVKIEVA